MRPFRWAPAFENADDAEPLDIAATEAALAEITALPPGAWQAFAGFATPADHAARMAEAREHNARCRQPRAEPKRRRRGHAEAAGVLIGSDQHPRKSREPLDTEFP